MPRLGLSLTSKQMGGAGVEVYTDTMREYGYPNTFTERQWFCSGSAGNVTYGGSAGGLEIGTGSVGRHALVHFDCLKDTNAAFDMGFAYGAGGQVVYAGIYGHGLYQKTDVGAGGGSGGYPPIFSNDTSLRDINGWNRYRPVDTSIRKITISNSSVADANGVYYRASGGTDPFTKVSSGTIATIFWDGSAWYLFVDGLGNVARNTNVNIDSASWLPWTGNATGITAVNKNDMYRYIPNGKSLSVSFNLECKNASVLQTDLNGLRVGLLASDGFYINTDNHLISNSSFQNYTGYMASYGTRHRLYKRKTNDSNLIWTTTAYDQKTSSTIAITTPNPVFSINLKVTNNNNIPTFQSSINGFEGNGSIGTGIKTASFTEPASCPMSFDTLVVASTSGVMDSFKVTNVTARIV